MNVERLKQLTGFLLALEKSHQIQTRFKELGASLENFVNQPHDQGAQNDLVAKQNALRSALEAAHRQLTPAQIFLIRGIGAEDFFGPKVTDDISALISRNPMTPVVVRDHVNVAIKQRAAYLNYLINLDAGLTAIGVKVSDLKPGEAEIGFQIPRSLFENNLEGLEKELHILHHIMRLFSEVTIGRVEPIEVRQISTSDPIFFFGLDVTTLVALAAAITWALDVWKRVDEIRKITQQAKSAGVTEGTQRLLESEIKVRVTHEVDNKVAELLQNVPAGRERKNELEAGLKWALNSLLAQIERGLMTEIRIEPPKPQVSDAPTSEGEQKVTEAFGALGAIAKKMEFPRASEQPILQLPDPQPGTKPKI